jgi:molecular chaperone GrpE (heat shock protein)
MADDSTLAGFGWVLTGLCISGVFGLVGRRSGPAIVPPTVVPLPAPAPDQLAALQQQCLRLRAELQQQQAQLTIDFQAATFEQLQPLLTTYPSARKMAEAKPELPARNFSALFTSLENLLAAWGIDPIGPVWAEVPYNPQCHQAGSEDIAAGEAVYIRFVGYQQGDRILCPAQVSRTLPL